MFYFFWSVPGSRYCSRYFFFFGFNDKRRNTYRSDFVRYQAATWKQPCVAFRGQGDAAVRQIASMNYCDWYTIVNACRHNTIVSQLAGDLCNKLTTDADWRRVCIYVGQITNYVLPWYVDHLDPNLPFWGAVQGVYITDPTQATCPGACSICGSYPAMWARSHRSGIHQPRKS